MKNTIVKVCGLIMAAFAIFSLIAAASYLFTWKADLSLLGDPQKMDLVVPVRNSAGKLGAEWAYLIVGRWFGLGAFALVLAIFIFSARLLFGKQSFSVIKAVLLSVFAAVLTSFICSWASDLIGQNIVLGGGLGGECGTFAVVWMENLFGGFLTGIIIAILWALWLLVASKKFSRWFLGIEVAATKLPKPVKKSEAQRVPKEPKVKETDSEKDGEEKTGKKFNFLGKVEGADAGIDAGSGVDVGAAVTSGVVAGGAEEESAGAGDSGSAGNGGVEVITGNELSTEVVEDLPRIDVRDELKDFRFPPLHLLNDYTDRIREVSQEELNRNNIKIRAALKTFKIDVDNVKAVVGPTVTLYKVYPSPGVKISSIRSRIEDISMALNSKRVRAVALSDSVGFEVPNERPSIVPLKALLNDAAFRDSDAELPVAVGYTITQKVMVFDLAEAPHLLVAGATKQGKSVGLNVLITSLLYAKHPSELKFVFIDPKMVEFSAYANLIDHYLAVLPTAGSEEDEYNTAIAKTADQAKKYLSSLCVEMDERYKLLNKAMVNKVTLYNEKYKNRHLLPTEGHRYLPYLVVVVDEFADLTMSAGTTGDAKAAARTISSSIIRLAQKGRAAGINMVIATQRPSVDVITGSIKANFPTRIAFRVLSVTDSRTILDSPGAEKLIGYGDMIYYAGVEKERIQCAFISNDEILDVNKFIGDQKGYKKSYNTPYYLPAPEEDKTEDGVAMIDMKNLDERFEEAARMVVTSQRGSTSDLQRRLGMGYAKAGRVMDQLEAAGIVGPQEGGGKPRQVLVSTFNELDEILKAYMNQ